MRKKRAKYNIITSLLLQITTIIFGFIVPKLIIESYGSGVNGLINSITQFLGYITLLETGIGGVLKYAYYKPLATKNNKELSGIVKSSEIFFRKIAYIFIIYIVVMCFVYPMLVRQNFNYIFTVSLILIIALSSFAQYYFGLTYQLLIQSDQKKYVTDIVQILSYILNTISIVLLIRFNFSIQIVQLVSTLIFVIRPLVFNWYVKKNYVVDKKAEKNDSAISQRWDGFGHQIAAMIHNSTDIAVITIFRNVLEVSVYSVYALITRGIKAIIMSISGSLGSSFGNMFANDEKDSIEKNFKKYEYIHSLITFIVFTITILVSVPFVSLYTSGIKDVNYIRPFFSVIIIVAEGIYCLRDSFSMLIFAKGDFKQTKKGAYIEATINIVSSIILVQFFGIIGVAIGTLIAMLYRAIDYVVYVSKNIVHFNYSKLLLKYLLYFVVSILLYLIINNKFVDYITNYYGWIIYSIIISLIVSFIFIVVNIIFYKNNFKSVLEIVKRKR